MDIEEICKAAERKLRSINQLPKYGKITLEIGVRDGEVVTVERTIKETELIKK